MTRKNSKNASKDQPALVRQLNKYATTVTDTFDADGVLKKRSEKYAVKALGQKSQYLGAAQSVIYFLMLYIALVTDTVLKIGKYGYELNKEYGPVLVKKITDGVKGLTSSVKGEESGKRRSGRFSPFKKHHD